MTFLSGFAVLGWMAHKVHTRYPPVPEKVVTDGGAVLFTGRDIFPGQQAFGKYGLMQQGLKRPPIRDPREVHDLTSYWHARSPEFYAQPLVRALEWARLPGDVLVIVGGIVPIVCLALRMFYWRNRPATVGAGESTVAFVTRPL